MRTVLKKVWDLHDRVMRWLGFVAPTVTRLVAGWGLMKSGEGKLGNLEGVGTWFGTLHLPYTTTPLPEPMMQAKMVASVEFYGGLLLMLGLFTRPVALALVGAMTGAILLSDSADFVNKMVEASPTDVAAFMYWVLCLWLIFSGAGPLSVDGAIAYVFRHFVADCEPLRKRVTEMVLGWVARGLILLMLLAIVPVAAPGDPLEAGVIAHTFKGLGIKREWKRMQFPDEVAEGEEPKEVVEFVPDLGGLMAYAAGLIVLGGIVLVLARKLPHE